ncbi:unnamed protein product [Haemonchus placei]|uniref:Uncharacterized protein n=1 Tax=Haemonchus placei TaxID=6290 RepID=A0A0N4WD50_HAEPC|nr:unnamed protein product [Haemonchus placei]
MSRASMNSSRLVSFLSCRAEHPIVSTVEGRLQRKQLLIGEDNVSVARQRKPLEEHLGLLGPVSLHGCSEKVHLSASMRCQSQLFFDHTASGTMTYFQLFSNLPYRPLLVAPHHIPYNSNISRESCSCFSPTSWAFSVVPSS